MFAHQVLPSVIEIDKKLIDLVWENIHAHMAPRLQKCEEKKSGGNDEIYVAQRHFVVALSLVSLRIDKTKNENE